MPLCDRVGIRTQDLLLRRQLLYPAELLDLCILTLLAECISVAGLSRAKRNIGQIKKQIVTTLTTATAWQRYKKLSLPPKHQIKSVTRK